MSTDASSRPMAAATIRDTGRPVARATRRRSDAVTLGRDTVILSACGVAFFTPVCYSAIGTRDNRNGEKVTLRLPSIFGFAKGHTLPNVRCFYCRRASAKFVCPGCEKKKRPTRLRAWLMSRGVPVKHLAERARVSERIVRYAADGKPVGARVAMELHRVTGIELRALLTGD